MSRRKCHDSPEVRAVLLASLWAQEIGLPVNSPWIGPVARHIVREWQALGADANAWGFVEATYRMRLGLAPPEAQKAKGPP